MSQLEYLLQFLSPGNKFIQRKNLILLVLCLQHPALAFACPIHRLNGKRPKGVNSHRERKHDKHKKTIKGKQTKLCDERETHSSTTFKKLVPENDSHETSFHQNFFLVTSSLYFRSAAVCVSTTLIRPIRRRASRHDTRKHFWENSLIIIFLWALRERGPSNNKTKLFFASLYCFRYLEMIFHDTWILYAMSFPCNLFFTTCSAAHTNPRATKTEGEGWT